MKDRNRLPVSFSILIGILLFSCSAKNYSYYKNIKVTGYVINTSEELLKEKKIVSPSPRVEYYFVPSKSVNKDANGITFKDKAQFYELDVCNFQYHEALNFEDTLYYQEKGSAVYWTLVSKENKLLIKKGVKKKNLEPFKCCNQKGYSISLNKKDTISITLNSYFDLVGFDNY